MGKGQARNAGFSLIEAIFALSIAGVLVGFGYLYVGRKIVDDTDPVRAAKEAGFDNVRVIQRSNFPAPFGACGADGVRFLLTGTKASVPESTFTICCPSWYGKCLRK